MAAVRDLLPRATALGATCIYQGQPAGWLLKAARAAAATPVVVNGKQNSITIVILRRGRRRQRLLW